MGNLLGLVFHCLESLIYDFVKMTTAFVMIFKMMVVGVLFDSKARQCLGLGWAVQQFLQKLGSAKF